MMPKKYKLIATTQEVGYSAWATLDYALQDTKFEPYENLSWDTSDNSVISKDLGEGGIGTVYIVPAKDQLTNERYILHVEAIKDISNEDDEGIGTDYLWQTSLYQEQS
tara:strand:+ start:331 stop:654 length:324 start_codon:yes stop_codon:yes gene_type:complete